MAVWRGRLPVARRSGGSARCGAGIWPRRVFRSDLCLDREPSGRGPSRRRQHDGTCHRYSARRGRVAAAFAGADLRPGSFPAARRGGSRHRRCRLLSRRCDRVDRLPALRPGLVALAVRRQPRQVATARRYPSRRRIVGGRHHPVQPDGRPRHRRRRAVRHRCHCRIRYRLATGLHPDPAPVRARQCGAHHGRRQHRGRPDQESGANCLGRRIFRWLCDRTSRTRRDRFSSGVADIVQRQSRGSCRRLDLFPRGCALLWNSRLRNAALFRRSGSGSCDVAGSRGNRPATHLGGDGWIAVADLGGGLRDLFMAVAAGSIVSGVIVASALWLRGWDQAATSSRS